MLNGCVCQYHTEFQTAKVTEVACYQVSVIGMLAIKDSDSFLENTEHIFKLLSTN